MNNKVSVVIPTYNSSKHVTKAIDSVLAQDYSNHEIIVVDDGSTDDTREVLGEYTDRLKYVYQDNGGPAKARNTGIMHAQGDYIAFLDADDLWLPTKLRVQIHFLRSHSQYTMVYTDMKLATEGKIVYDSFLQGKNYQYISSGFIYENLLRETFIFTSTVMVKSECLKKVGPFKEHLKGPEDIDLWLRIADEYQIGFLDSATIIRNIHENNLTKNRFPFATARIRMLDEAYEKNKENRERTKIIEEKLALNYFHLGYYCFQSGQLKQSRYNFLKSLKYRYSTKLVLYTLASFLPQSWINGVRGLKRKIKDVGRVK